MCRIAGSPLNDFAYQSFDIQRELDITNMQESFTSYSWNLWNPEKRPNG